MMRRHLQRRHSDNLIWQTTDIRSFIDKLSIQTMKLLSNQTKRNVTVASTFSDDVQNIQQTREALNSAQSVIQETEVPLKIGAENDDELETCPSAFLFVDDSNCLENCSE